MKKKTKILLVVVFIFGALFALRLFSSRQVSGARSPAAAGPWQQKVTVKTAPVNREDLNLVLTYVGSLKAKDEANVFSKVSGKISEYTINEGDSVEKGQTIALIDRDETGLKYELAKVDAPIFGVVGRIFLDKGANVLPSAGLSAGTSVATVLDMDEMVVRINVPEADIPYFKKGLAARIKVDAYPQEDFQGEVTRVSEVVDTQTRTLPIEIGIINSDHRLKSGMFCRIKIIAFYLKDRLVLSQDALVQELGQNYVFIAEDNVAKKKMVKLGVRDDGKIEVLEGLMGGERIIIFGQQGLKDGAGIEAVQE